jgi:hypothetical protein
MNLKFREQVLFAATLAALGRIASVLKNSEARANLAALIVKDRHLRSKVNQLSGMCVQLLAETKRPARNRALPSPTKSGNGKEVVAD